MQRQPKRLPRLLAALAVLVAAACTDAPTGPVPRGETVDMRVTANVSGTPINVLVVEVTAPDITTPLVFNLTIQNGVASGTVKVPSGNARTFTVRAYDTAGNITHEGSTTVDVSPGQNPVLNLVLGPKNGQVPINVTIASYSVVVSPAADTLAPGDSVQLVATVLDALGQPVAGAQVDWATANPSRALVSASGMLVAQDTGTVLIMATYEGVGGTSMITVSTGGGTTPPAGGAFVWQGDVSSDWSVAGNWDRNAVPGAADTAYVPVLDQVANPALVYPVLSQDASVGPLTVADGATVQLSSFTLTATDNVSSAATTGGIQNTTGRLVLSGTTRTLSGIIPAFRVTGTYAFAGNVTARAPGDVNMGRLTNAGFRFTIVAN